MTVVTEQMTQATPPKYTWVLVAWGIFSIIAGVLLVTQPGITAVVWVQILAVYMAATGIVDIIGAILQRQGAWLIQVLAGALSLIAGGFVLANPLLGTIFAVQVLFYFLVLTAIVNAIINLWYGFQKPRSWGQIALGVFQLILGLWLFGHPLVGLLALVPGMGIYLIAYGIVSLGLAFMTTRQS